MTSPTSRTATVKLTLGIDGLGLVSVLDVVGEDGNVVEEFAAIDELGAATGVALLVDPGDIHLQGLTALVSLRDLVRKTQLEEGLHAVARDKKGSKENE